MIRRARLAVVAAIGLVLTHWLALFDGALLGGETFFARDITPFHKPLLRLAARLWQESPGLPLWNPYLSWGQPWLANPNASPLHPLTLLAVVAGDNAALVANVVLPPLLGVAAMFLFLRVRGCCRAAAFYGGLVWGFGGYLLSTTNLLAAAKTAALLPAALAFARLTSRRGRPLDVVGLAVTAAVVFAGLEPTILLAFAALIAVTLLEPPDTAVPESGRKRRVLLVGVGLAVALLASAAVVVPVARLAPRTARSTSLTATQWSDYALAPPRLLEPVTPHLLGPVDFRDPERYWGTEWYGDKQLPYLASLYLGLMTVALATAGVMHGRWGERLWALTGGSGLVLALSGNFPPWLATVFRTPPLGQLRYTEKWAIVPVLAAIVLAVHALDRLLDGDRRVRRTTMLALAGAATVGLAVAAVQLAAPGSATARALLGIGAADRATAAAAAAIKEAAILLGLAASYTLALWVLRHNRRGGVALLLTITALDLYRVGKPLVPTAPRAWADAPPTLLEPLLRRDPPPRLYHLAEWQPTCAGLSGVAWPPEPAGFGIPLAFPRDFDITQLVWSHNAGKRFRSLVASDPALLFPGLRRRGVGAVALCASTPTGPAIDLRLVSDAQPDLFCADRVLVATGAAGWEAATREIGADAPTTVVVDGASLPDAAKLPASPSPCTVQLRGSSPGLLIADTLVAGPGPGVLAINQTWDDHWRVEVDGRPTPLLRAEICLSATVVPPGAHRLELRYRDQVAIVSVWVSAIAVAALALAAAALGRRRG